jgi:hypothetical protein
MRCLGLLRSDKSSEAGEPPDPEMMVRFGPFMEEITKAGVLVATDGLKPSSFGKRVKLESGRATVIDGPFTESKELVASYALLQVNSIDEAVYWTRRFLEVLGGGECEVRPLYEPADFSSECCPPEEAAREEARRALAKRNAAGG